MNRSGEAKSEQTEVKIAGVTAGYRLPFILIAGPDSIESEGHALFMAKNIKAICERLGIPYIFKASYDKANRTAVDSWRGLGLEAALPIFEKIKTELGLPVTTDVHSPGEAAQAGKVVDLIQIPALLSRQTDIILAAARTGRAVNVKKGQFMAPDEIGAIIGKIRSAGNERILVTERGTVFGYHNLVADMRSLAAMRRFGYPIIFDASHTVQLPAALGGRSGGEREMIPVLARAAIGAGVAGIFLEVHDDPDRAPVDGLNSLDLKDLEPLLETLLAIDRIVKKSLAGKTDSL